MSTPPSTSILPEDVAKYNGKPLVILAIAFIPIATIFTGLRILARHLSDAAFGLDDVLALLSWALSLGVSTLSICFVRYGGVGHHFAFWDITDPSKKVTYFKYLFAVSTYYFLPVSVPKLSILAFYNRIFVAKPYRMAIRVLAAIIIASAFVNIIVSFFLCRPLPYYWDRTIPGGRCYDLIAYYTWTGFPNIITDFAMIVLPLRAVWKLNTSASVKMGLTGAFATGGLGLGGSIVKFVLFKYNAITDGTWHSTQLMIWGSVECYCYLLAACMIAFRPLVVHIIRRPKTEPKITDYKRPSRTSPQHVVSLPSLRAENSSRTLTASWRDDDQGNETTSNIKDGVLVMVDGRSKAQSEKSVPSP